MRSLRNLRRGKPVTTTVAPRPRKTHYARPRGSCEAAYLRVLFVRLSPYRSGVDDFCLWGPTSSATIGDSERSVVAWCTKAGHGTRNIPNGALKGVHFVQTPTYVQITGVGDFTKIKISAGDA
jgi:hypothetical protein